MGAVFRISTEMRTFGPCCSCGIDFAAPSSFVTDRMQKGGTFFCPNGHSQHYTESENEKLRKRLASEEQRRELAEKTADTARKAEAIARGKLRAQSERRRI